MRNVGMVEWWNVGMIEIREKKRLLESQRLEFTYRFAEWLPETESPERLGW
jgi:hypothetical protein